MKESYGILKFLEKLAANNNREWFNDHRAEFLEFKQLCDKTAERFIALVAEYEPEARYYGPSDCTYRIYRDTRFSTDKTPYKTHFGIFVNPPLGKKAETMGYYLHMEPGNSFFAAGTGWSSPKVLKALRQGVYDEIDEYREIVESERFREFFQEIGMDKLKTAPKGFPKDWQFIDYLKPRVFGATGRVDDEFFKQEDWTERLRGFVEEGRRYNRFCNYFVKEALGMEPD